MAVELDILNQDAAATDGEGTTPAPEAEKSGRDRRIDELTANWRETQRELAAQRDQNTQMLALIAAGQQTHHEVAAPAFEIDPEEQKKLDYIIGRATQPLQEEIKKLRQSVAQQGVGSAVSGLESDLREINNPAVTQLTRKLLADWSQKGLLQNGTVVPQDALDIAMGKVALEERKASNVNKQERAQFNSHGAPLAGQGPAGGSKARTPAKLKDVDPRNLNQQQLEKYVELMDNEMADVEF